MFDPCGLLFWLAIVVTLGLPTEGRFGRVKRIAGGDDAKPGEFPYQVSLRYGGVHICGGALIGDRHVLSAAHCVCELIDEPYDELTVVTSTVKISAGGQTHLVKNVRCHPGFRYGLEASWENDIVVITLNETIKRSESQSPALLPNDADIVVGEPAVLTGWGRSNPNGYLHKTLQKLTVAVIDNADCQERYNNTILPSQICTFKAKGSGACKGDSGSPLVSNGTILGIFSWTRPCALGSPDVYSRVYHYLEFIKSAMQEVLG